TTVKEKSISDQNGSEVVPYGSPQIDDLIGWLEGSFGVGNRGRPFIDKEPDSEEVRFYPIDDDYKELLEYMHKLYDEGLIAQNIFSIEKDQFVANAAEGGYGSTVFYDPGIVIHEKVADVYTGGIPLRGPNGKQSKVLGHTVSDIGAFAITDENEHPEATMRWVDHFYSDEGAKLLFLGVEGESYHETEDGEIELANEIANPPEGRTQDQELAEHAGYLPTSGTPGILKEEYFKGAETTPDALKAKEGIDEHNHWKN